MSTEYNPYAAAGGSPDPFTAQRASGGSPREKRRRRLVLAGALILGLLLGSLIPREGALRVQVASLEAESSALVADRDAALREVDETEGVQVALNQATSELEGVQAELNRAETERDAAIRRAETAEAAEASLEEQRSALDDLEAQLVSREEEVVARESAVAELEVAAAAAPAASRRESVPATREPAAPAPAPAAPAAPAPAAPAAPTNESYRNCDAARAAGAAPVLRGDPGYGSHLDRDNDGVGCE